MLSVDTIRTSIGTIGNVVSFLLFASPLPTFWDIWKKKDVEGYQPYPYVATVMNCMLWVFYGLPIVHPDSTLVITINGIGLVLELIYILIYVIYCDKKWRAKIGGLLLLEVVFIAILAIITFTCFHTYEAKSTFVGVFCVIFGVCMYASPFMIMYRVVKTKSVKYMPLSISITCLVNGIIWFAYARLKIIDINIEIPNGTGAAIAAIQLVMYTYYRCKYPKGGVEPYQVELSGSNSVSKQQQRASV